VKSLVRDNERRGAMGCACIFHSLFVLLLDDDAYARAVEDGELAGSPGLLLDAF
jgi:hypothetical protein